MCKLYANKFKSMNEMDSLLKKIQFVETEPKRDRTSEQTN